MTAMGLRLAALTVTAIVNLLLAAVVFKNNSRSATNKIFGGLAIITSLWLVDIYFSVDPSLFSHEILWVRMSIFLAVLQIALFFLLAHTLPSTTVNLSRTKLRLLLLAVSLLMLDALSPYLFTKTQIIDKTIQATAGPGMVPFVLFALAFCVLALWTLFRKLRKSVGYIKEQYRFIFLGILIMLGLLFATVLVPVAIFKNSLFVPLVPLYTIIFLGSTTYAIVAQKLFDIRAAVAKSVGYLLIIGSMSFVYAIGLFGVINVLFKGASHETLRQVLSILLLTPLAVSFQYIKRFFDRVTNRLFYRESYDFQEVLDRTGNIVVANIELNNILNSTRSVLSEALKSSFIEFVLMREGKAYFETRHHLEPYLKNLEQQITEQRRELIVTDEMHEQNRLREPLREAQVALSLRLRTQKQIVGYVLIGEKRNGEGYAYIDRRLLSIVANELAIAIQNALRFEEIQNFNLTLQGKVDEATHKLRKANERLKALDETKDDFISMASHQLRTPLTSVKGFVSLVLDGDAGGITKTQRKLLGQAFSGAQRMVDLISDLLNVSRLKTGKFIIEPVATDLSKTVDEEMGRLQEIAASRNLTLTYKKPEHFPTLMVDELKTRQVIMNFIDNAIWYTPAGGHVTVNLVDQADAVELMVVDDGIGVPEAEKKHLFTKFYRAPNAQKARPDGTGIGLYLAKEVVSAQGGELIFKSQEGKGSTFGFRLEKAKLPVASSKPARSNTVIAVAAATKKPEPELAEQKV